MSETNDHDLLISINATLKVLTDQQKDFIARYEVNHADIVSRVVVLENKDSRDSERFKGIADEIRRSLANSEKITGLTSDVNALGVNLRAVSDSVKDLSGKSFRFDLVLGAATIAATVLAIFLR